MPRDARAPVAAALFFVLVLAGSWGPGPLVPALGRLQVALAIAAPLLAVALGPLAGARRAWALLAGSTALATLVIAARAGPALGDAVPLLLFLVATLAWCAAWIGIVRLLGALVPRRGAAFAAGVAAWLLFVILWSVIEVALLLQQYGAVALRAPQEIPAPWWLALVEALNPNSAWKDLLATLIPGFVDRAASLATIVGAPGYAWPTFAFALAAWIAAPPIAAAILTRRRQARP